MLNAGSQPSGIGVAAAQPASNILWFGCLRGHRSVCAQGVVEHLSAGPRQGLDDALCRCSGGHRRDPGCRTTLAEFRPQACATSSFSTRPPAPWSPSFAALARRPEYSSLSSLFLVWGVLAGRLRHRSAQVKWHCYSSLPSGKTAASLDSLVPAGCSWVSCRGCFRVLKMRAKSSSKSSTRWS